MHSSLIKRRGFTMIEILVVIAIIGILSTLGIRSFISSQIKGRDVRRKADLANIAKPLEAYFNDYGSYPESDSDGNILGCGTDGAEACSWGQEFVNDKSTIYMVQLPADPRLGTTYFYQSDGEQWALYAWLENTQDQDVVLDGDGNPSSYGGTDCGSSACNYQITSTNYQ